MITCVETATCAYEYTIIIVAVKGYTMSLYELVEVVNQLHTLVYLLDSPRCVVSIIIAVDKQTDTDSSFTLLVEALDVRP